VVLEAAQAGAVSGADRAVVDLEVAVPAVEALEEAAVAAVGGGAAVAADLAVVRADAVGEGAQMVAGGCSVSR
jgi:hypothetical protein